MPQQEFALGLLGASRVRTFWNDDQEKGIEWNNMVVCLDQTILGRIADKQELVAGRVFTLPDNSVLKVQLFGGQLEAYRNGEVLPSLASATVKRSRPTLTPSDNILLRWRLAYCATFFIAGLNI